MKDSGRGFARRWTALVVVLLELSGAPAHALGRQAGSGALRLDGGRLTGRFSGERIVSVLDALGRVSGVRVEWRGEAGADLVSTEFIDLPLAEAIDRLLRPRSYFLVYGSEHRLIRIVVISDPGERLAPETAPSLAPPEVVAPDLDGLDPVVAAMLADPEPAVRMQLLENILRLPLDDPSVETVLVRLAADSDPSVRQTALMAVRQHASAPERAGRRRSRRPRSE